LSGDIKRSRIASNVNPTPQVAPPIHPFAQQRRGRVAVEPVIRHTKTEHRMGRNSLKGRDRDCINAVLAAAGYNFGLLQR
jgi:IS5 family transposase